MLKRLFITACLLSAIAVAGAQDFFHRPSPLAGRTMLTLSLFDEVRAELKTTADQNTKTDALVEKMGADMQEAFQSSGGDPSAIHTAMDKMSVKYDEEVVKVLTPDQVMRLKGLFIQFNGSAAVATDAIGKDVSLTDDQKMKLKKLEDDAFQKDFETFQGAAGSPEEAAAGFKKNRDELNAGIDKLLTDDQKAKLKTMQGADFTFKKS